MTTKELQALEAIATATETAHGPVEAKAAGLNGADVRTLTNLRDRGHMKSSAGKTPNAPKRWWPTPKGKRVLAA